MDSDGHRYAYLVVNRFDSSLIDEKMQLLTNTTGEENIEHLVFLKFSSIWYSWNLRAKPVNLGEFLFSIPFYSLQTSFSVCPINS